MAILILVCLILPSFRFSNTGQYFFLKTQQRKSRVCLELSVQYKNVKSFNTCPVGCARVGDAAGEEGAVSLSNVTHSLRYSSPFLPHILDGRAPGVDSDVPLDW
jgi:hypothetical protein